MKICLFIHTLIIMVELFKKRLTVQKKNGALNPIQASNITLDRYIRMTYLCMLENFITLLYLLTKCLKRID